MRVGVIDAKTAEQHLRRATEQVRLNLPYYTNRCQSHSSKGGIYPACRNTQWSCGFWPGEIWLAYRHTKEPCFRSAGMALVDSFDRRIRKKICVNHHDMGFLYLPSCVMAYDLTGSRRAADAALLAADQLLTRFQPRGGYLQAWGPMGAPGCRRFIIDCLLNLPLLYWAGEITGNERYANVANLHAAACLQHSFREDGSTFHTFYMRRDGSPSRGASHQGYRADSAWARGQAWAVYGCILLYRLTGDRQALALFQKSLAFYLSRLPEDMVPCWDLIFSDNSGEPRDSSAAAIVACALLEAAGLPVFPKTPAPSIGKPSASAHAQPLNDAAEYYRLACRMLESLSGGYAVKTPIPRTGLLLHGTYCRHSPHNTCVSSGVDECTGWGDYFYMEALTRLTHPLP